MCNYFIIKYLFFILFLGAVGHPFPGVRVAISKPNVYSTNSYDVIAKGNSTNTNVTKGNNHGNMKMNFDFRYCKFRNYCDIFIIVK